MPCKSQSILQKMLSRGNQQTHPALFRDSLTPDYDAYSSNPMPGTSGNLSTSLKQTPAATYLKLKSCSFPLSACLSSKLTAKQAMLRSNDSFDHSLPSLRMK